MSQKPTETVSRAYRYRFYPTDEQKRQLARTFGSVRFVYNYFLDKRTKAWTEHKESMSYVACAKELTQLKAEAETIWLNEVSNVCLQQSLRRLDRAFQNFFQKRAKYPKFKKRYYQQSARYQKNGFRMKDGKLYLAKQKTPLSIRWSRPLPEGANILSITVAKDSSSRYYISFQVEEQIKTLSPTNQNIGLDLGLKDSVITSQGCHYANPRPLKQWQQKLARAQRRLARKKLRSNNRKKQRIRVARIHRKIGDIRRDFHHKLSSHIISENQAIAVESLDVKGMQKNKRLSRAIADAGWRQLLGFLQYKAKWYGRQLLEVDQWFPSSKLCSSCHVPLQELSLATREWICPHCGVSHDRDVNAAQNILWFATQVPFGTWKEYCTVGPTET